MARMTDANGSGDRLTALKALAAELAERMDGTDDVRTIASLARQYRETLADIDTLTNAEDDDGGIAEIIRRAARRG